MPFSSRGDHAIAPTGPGAGRGAGREGWRIRIDARYAGAVSVADEILGSDREPGATGGLGSQARPGRMERLGLTALAYGPFRIYFAANLFSNASWFIFSAGLNTYILQITGSAGTVGLASFIYSLPSALFMLHAGILTDRFGARRLVVFALAGGGTCVLGVGALALAGMPLPLILAFGFVLGIMQTLGSPGFISIVNDLVPRSAISSGVALTFLGFNVGRITGGVGAGILLLAFGPDVIQAAGLTILVAGILQVVPALPVSRIRITETASRTTNLALWQPLVETASYAARHPTLGIILLLAVAPGAIGLAYMFMLPVVVRDLGLPPDSVGLLYAAGGVGGLSAGLVAEPLMRRLGHGRTIFLGLSASAVGLAAAGLAAVLPIAMVGIGLAQVGFVVYPASSLALVQAMAPARLRGRLTSLFALLYWGLMPFGALIEGTIAQATNSLVTLVIMGIAILTIGVVAIVVRRQVFGLRLSRDGRDLLGDLDGTGFEPLPPADAPGD